MDCAIFNDQLDEWLDGTLDDGAAAAVSAHASRCRACSHLLASSREMRHALRLMPVPRPRPGFAREAIRLARLTHTTQSLRTRGRDGFYAMAGAAAAGLGVAAILLLRDPSGLSGLVPGLMPSLQASFAPASSFQTVAMTVGHVEAVRLRIDSPRDFDEVQFSVELPDHVWLADQPGIRAMTWAGPLRKGENMLELPLVARSRSAGLLTARVSWGSFEQRLQAQLVGDAGVASAVYGNDSVGDAI